MQRGNAGAGQRRGRPGRWCTATVRPGSARQAIASLTA